MAILGAITWIAYYLAQDSVNLNKNASANRSDQKLDAAVKYFYEASDCCQMLASYQAIIDANKLAGNTSSCGDLVNDAANAAMIPPSGSGVVEARRSIPIQNSLGRPLYDEAGTQAEGLFPGYYHGGDWNLSAQCVSGAARENGQGPTTASLGLFKFADRKDRRTGKSQSQLVRIKR